MEKQRKMVFVSVPMKERSEDEIKRALQTAEQAYLRITGLNVRDVIFIHNYKGYEEEQLPELVKTESLIYLGRAIKQLAYADEAIFGKGCENANGCMVERMVCILYGIKFYEMKGEQEK